MLFSDNPIISTVAVGRKVLEAKSDSECREKSETYQQKRQENIQQHSDQLAMMLLVNPDVKDLSPSEKVEYAKKFNEKMGKFFDLQYEILNKKIIGNWAWIRKDLSGLQHILLCSIRSYEFLSQSKFE